MTAHAPSSNATPTSRRARPVHRATWAAVLTLAIGVVASFAAASVAQIRAHDAARAQFERDATRVAARLQHNLLDATTVLRGARSFAVATAAQPGDAWQRYVDSLDLDSLHSPVHAVGIISAPSAADDDPATQRALRRAAETGKVALAARLVRDSADATADRPDLALYLPIGTIGNVPPAGAPQRAAPGGFVYAGLDAHRLFDLSSLAPLGLRVTTDNPPTVVYAGEPLAADESVHRTDTLTFGGTTLSLVYSAPLPGASSAAIAVLLVGIALSMAFAACVRQAVAWRQAQPAAPGNSSPLTEARMMGIIRSSMEAIITVDESQTIVIFNPAAEHVFGVSAMDAIGAPLSRFIPERFRATHAKHVEQFGVTGVSERQMGRQRVLFGLRGDGTEFPIEASISQIRDGTGKLYTVMLRDATERVRSENALKQSRQELRELSANLQNIREEEKTRIARELHDDLGQQLTALKMDLSAVELGLAKQPAPGVGVRDQLSGMHRLIDTTVASVRRIAADLRPVMLDDLGLVPAIEWLVNDFTHRYGIEVERHIDPADTSFTSAGATTLFRIVQEALTNVARHADATCVVLVLKVADGYCMLRIADNGHGAPEHPPAARDHPSFGLIGIRERAHMLDGTVTIDSEPGKGFTITVALPLHAIQQGGMLS
ncbi:PAS domain S-box protein [Burkholderia ubonensis]|uniref:PAS domain S-box protein n=1 Tax=Burkholderia ubonensis TaxID=101571 RepID=UPI000F58B38D|nr:PAS domain S-box protein [Burkholderia ubonensis]RQP27739.1 PAS domain S-box protein [Burkholderia ubonensis]RQP29755.1 PAS domain S-box protein [Burkholderia ubonensis]RQP31911.1 PAS domain S-box protein [Burkholderia ubonensis]RQP47854.1 PAS domain S-box protein [Burkholderia ubonensis]RQP50871.1 PAS domain S-box protein [Burkholderia ubonensis]